LPYRQQTSLTDRLKRLESSAEAPPALRPADPPDTPAPEDAVAVETEESGLISRLKSFVPRKS
ncbi:MAG: hypothetical protein AAFV96_09120, partial [Pseudomonadota bacterium]